MVATADLARDLAAALDPVVLARRADIEPDDWQVDVLRSVARRALWNVARQCGKSSMGAVLAMHGAIYSPRSLTLLVSPSLRQSVELFRKCLDIYRALGRPVPTEAESALRLELDGGSRVLSLPGSHDTVRGFSAPNLVVIDEVSRTDDELLASITPMLATAPTARLLAISTPAGKRGWWWRMWQDGGDDWERITVRAEDVPRIPRSFLALERRTMPARTYAQEYECSFEESDAAVFAADAVSSAIDHGREPLRLEVLRRWAS